MFSLEKGTPIGKITNSKTFPIVQGKSKQIGLISKPGADDEPGYQANPYELLNGDDIQREIGTNSQKRIAREAARKLKKIKKMPKGEVGTRFLLNDGELTVLPDTSVKRECCYVAGMSNSGKSYWVAQYAKNYHEIFPNNRIFSFSPIMEERDLSDLYKEDVIEKIYFDEDLLDDIESGTALTIDDFDDSLVIFDDCGAIGNRKIKEYVYDLRNSLLTTGRHHNIYVICTSHLLTDKDKTRIQITESVKLTIFPKTTAKKPLQYFLEAYAGMDTQDMNKLLGLSSRWVTISRAHPRYVIHEKGCYLY